MNLKWMIPLTIMATILLYMIMQMYFWFTPGESCIFYNMIDK